ncbi:Pycsar system effector family protein [Lentzea sp. NPDC051213]|uniref:Pycsar system effector family protein n=1 Tax=Lentzea sp. NPDC051213 TaxID=3364126 RepID=UPI0037A464BE
MARQRHDHEQVQLAITQFSAWVSNADTKAGLLATATTLLGGGLASQRTVIRGAFPPTTTMAWVRVIAIGLSVLAVVVAVAALVVALRPRARKHGFSRYSWPVVASVSLEQYRARVCRAPGAEGWRTAHDLARIARAKFRCLYVATWAWAVGAVSFLAWTVLFV